MLPTRQTTDLSIYNTTRPQVKLRNKNKQLTDTTLVEAPASTAAFFANFCLNESMYIIETHLGYVAWWSSV